MIISHKHKFIFIKTRKTAGTSIEMMLRKICGKNDIITPLGTEDELKAKDLGLIPAQNYQLTKGTKLWRYTIPKKSKETKVKFYNHMPSDEVFNTIKKGIWRRYYTFCFDRNPYDKVISWYYFKNRNLERDSLPLLDFVKKGRLQNLNSFDMYTRNRLITVDDVYKFENLQESLKAIGEKLKIEESLELLSFKAKSGIRKQNVSYREHYNDELKELIGTIYARELKYLGYEF